MSLKKPKIGIVMEYCPLGDIQHYFQTAKKEVADREGKELEEMRKIQVLPIELKLQIIADVASGVQYLHQKDVIHRDLKPQNILLTDTMSAKIIDFGLSRVIKENIKKEEIHKTRRIGTSGFMGPEMSLGLDYTNKVDVFSFAILIYVIMTENFLPYGEDSREEMFNGTLDLKVAQNPDKRPRDDPSIPNIITRLMKRCWQHIPEDRPSFDQICEILGREVKNIKISVVETEKEKESGEEEEKHKQKSFVVDLKNEISDDEDDESEESEENGELKETEEVAGERV